MNPFIHPQPLISGPWTENTSKKTKPQANNRISEKKKKNEAFHSQSGNAITILIPWVFHKFSYKKTFLGCWIAESESDRRKILEKSRSSEMKSSRSFPFLHSLSSYYLNASASDNEWLMDQQLGTQNLALWSLSVSSWVLADFRTPRPRIPSKFTRTF